MGILTITFACFVVAMIVATIRGLADMKAQQRALEEARNAYQAALAQLSLHSAENSLRVAALEAGRHYADLARKVKGLGQRAVFDEVALTNDLNAPSGTAAATSAGMKKCPQCAELVRLDARICPFCQTRGVDRLQIFKRSNFSSHAAAPNLETRFAETGTRRPAAPGPPS